MRVRENNSGIFIVFIFGIILGVFALFVCQKWIFTSNKKHDVSIDYIRENELLYFETKSKLVTEIQNYVTKIAPSSSLRVWELVEICLEEEVDIAFVLAQGEVESKFGTKGTASATNSVWNVGAFDTLSREKIDKKFKYQHPNLSIKPYVDLLKTKYLNNKTIYDLFEDFVDEDGRRYASYEHYEKLVKGRYQYINEKTNIDSLVLRLNYYKLRCNK